MRMYRAVALLAVTRAMICVPAGLLPFSFFAETVPSLLVRATFLPPAHLRPLGSLQAMLTFAPCGTRVSLK
jgi:hypothetical protein